MQIHGGELLAEAMADHADLRKPLLAWRKRVAGATWRSFQEVRQDFAHADGLAKSIVIFDIKGNRYRVVARVGYQLGTVVVLWVGTHAEYDAIDVASLG